MKRASLSRAQLGIVALLSVFGLSLGGSPSPAPQATVAVAPARPPLDAAAVARIVGTANPTLSPRELGRIGVAVIRYSGKYEINPEIVTAVLLVESGARPWVRSPKGAMGLMQVMPNMSGPLALAGNSTTIESNVEAGCLILSDNIRRLGEEEGISAYFWGSDIRGVAYLQRIQAARERVRRLVNS
ncbi:MAG TPA: transglycosylase SLT domain-containing protein [Myxococcota bacterium]|nr:transglycosylase SLT domain-containing protein [Myxococcota bacterium]